MAVTKLNVLVYAGMFDKGITYQDLTDELIGAGSTDGSVRHVLYTLRLLLSPNYAVVPVTDSAIIKEPWTASCALLVFPGGADLGYCRSLNGKGNDRISQYVRRGGAYLGFCAGGYYGSQKCEFEVGDKKMEVIGRRELAFFPGICRGCAFKGFVYQSEAGARATEILVKKESFGALEIPKSFRSYYNGGGVFVDAAKYETQGVEILASYAEKTDVDGGEDENQAAVVYCKVGDGCAILTGPHPE
jgi:biotin--protein ligase